MPAVSQTRLQRQKRESVHESILKSLKALGFNAKTDNERRPLPQGGWVRFHLRVKYQRRPVYVLVTGERRCDRSKSAATRENFARFDGRIRAARRAGIPCFLADGTLREELETGDPRGVRDLISRMLDEQVSPQLTAERKRRKSGRRERREQGRLKGSRSYHFRSGRSFQTAAGSV